MLIPAALAQTWVAASTAYLLGLLGLAAARRTPAACESPGEPLRTVVLIPAHDEEAGLPATVRALRAQGFPAELIVIADNCADATAEVARAAGADVWERVHDDRGKGQALAWGLERLWRERPATEAVLIVDADCLPGPNFLIELEGALRRGAEAAQAVYDVGNPGASATAGLRWAGFALRHRVRPRGRAALGLSAGLFGTGMGFRAHLLRELPWRAFSIAEDLEYHVLLAQRGVRVAYVERAHLTSAMPTTDAAAHHQQMRWESGNTRLAGEHAAALLRSGLARRDANLLVTGAELLLPPQSLLVPVSAACLAAGALTRSRGLLLATVGIAAGQALYVLGGLRLAGAPPEVYRALAAAPRLVASKLPIFASIAGGGGATEWRRTKREPVVTQPLEVV